MLGLEAAVGKMQRQQWRRRLGGESSVRGEAAAAEMEATSKEER
jgi:hypothetical protein